MKFWNLLLDLVIRIPDLATCGSQCSLCDVNVCALCTSGYFLSAGYCCPNNCDVCTLGVCITCNAGFYLSLGLCNTCSTGCTACTTAISCSSCSSSYTLTLGYCCPVNCLTCVAGVCSVCNNGCYLSLGICNSCSNGCLVCTSATS